MDIAGTGITGTKTVKILPGWKPNTQLAYKWTKLASRQWTATDRGTTSDTYEAMVSVYGKEAVIDELIQAIEDNRAAESNVLTLSNFFTSEYIFGSDVDHSGSISATVIGYPKRKQNTFKGWGVDLTLRNLSPAFVGSSSFPTLSKVNFGVEAGQDWNINKYDDYSGNYTYIDKQYDAGTFQGVYTVTLAEMQGLRRYIAATRTGDYTLADTFGVDYPFGQRTANSYPYTVKLIDWEDLGLWGLQWYRVRLKFAETY